MLLSLGFPTVGLPCSTCSTTLRAFLAAHPPIETWSSVAALVDRESTEEGWHSTLFSDTMHGKGCIKRNPQVPHFHIETQTIPAVVFIIIIPSHTHTQGCSGTVCNHETGVEATFIDQEGRQLAQRRVTQAFDPPLTDGS